jgi:hypothetical protein
MLRVKVQNLVTRVDRRPEFVFRLSVRPFYTFFKIRNLKSLVDPLYGYRPHAKYFPKQDNTNAEKARIYIRARNGNCNHDPIFPLLKDITGLVLVLVLVPHKYGDSFNNSTFYVFLANGIL